MTHWSDSIDTSGYGQATKSFMGMQIQPSVFFPTAIIALLVIVATLVWPEASADVFSALRAAVVKRFDTFMMLAGDLLLLFCLVLALSPLGKLRLGGSKALAHFEVQRGNRPLVIIHRSGAPRR